MFEQFISNFTYMMEQKNEDEVTAGRPREAEPVKMNLLVGPVIVSEIQKTLAKKQNQSERTLKSLNYC